jgi:hypothetical protein
MSLNSLFGVASASVDGGLQEVSDRRRLSRFEVELPLKWEGGSAVVRDINATGVRFETNHPISAHEKMKFTIIIPDDEGRKCYRLLCDSEICWTAPSLTKPHKLNVGASFTMTKFIEVPLAA